MFNYSVDYLNSKTQLVSQREREKERESELELGTQSVS